VLDTAGRSMVRAVALEADRAMFAGAAKGPTGILTIAGLPSVDAAPDYAGLVTGSGLVRAAGGTPNVVYLNPADLTALQLAAAADDRPLISGDPTQGAPPVIAGLAVWATPAMPAGQALVAQADQIVVAVRQDASVAGSDAPLFTSDGTVARVIARLDAGINDPDGLAIVQDVVTSTAKSKS
jgi:HK97 family phage major capsid protein